MTTEPPGASRRKPPLGSPTWAVRQPLAAWLRSEAAGLGRRVRVLDVGCGVAPYRPFFEPYAELYVGLDSASHGAADVVGEAEQMPLEDDSFDVVLCNQVLEHAGDPAAVVRELARVVAPGGRVLLSTHGVQVYHPSPTDYWRWTAAGLERLFRECASWEHVRVEAGAGTAACLGMLAAFYVETVTKRTPLAAAGRALIAAINLVAATVDSRSTRLRDPFQPGVLIGNFHVTAVAPGVT